MNTSTHPEPEAARRARQWLLLGPALVDEPGRKTGEPETDVLQLMQQASAETSALMAVNQDLVPLMHQVAPPRYQPRWWRWFTGAQLEREVMFHDLQSRIQHLAEQGEKSFGALQLQSQLLLAEDTRMHAEVARLEADLAAVQLLLSPGYSGACQAAGLTQQDLARLARRADNLQAMATTTQLTQAQYRLAMEHARTVSDRFTEIRTLLMPLWKQAMGFELFSQPVAASNQQGR